MTIRTAKRPMKKYSLSPFVSLQRSSSSHFVGAINSSGEFLHLSVSVAKFLLDIAFEASVDRPHFTRLYQKYFPSATAEEVDFTFSQLIEAEVLVSSNTKFPQLKSGRSSLDWESNGWIAAKLFHQAIVYSNFLKGDAVGWQTQLEGMRDIRKSGLGPPITKTFPKRFPRIRLPAPRRPPGPTDFFDVLFGRRTRHVFNSSIEPSASGLSWLLNCAARAQTVLANRFFGDQMQRTSPSGGARTPVEIYPQIFSAKGIAKGSYYYDPIKHELVYLGSVSQRLLFELSQRQIKLNQNAFGFIITARFERNFWKYRYAKSYIFTHFDVAHFVQTLVLCCEAMGLKCFLTPALDVRMAQLHLGLDNIFDECPTYLVIAGNKDG